MKTLLSIAAGLGILAASAAAQDDVSQKKKELMEAQAMMFLAQAGSPGDLDAKKKQLMEAQQKMAYAITNGKVIGLEAGVMGPAVKGAPYSADEIHETTQVLADGTRIHNETKTTVYRDSQGRVRRESPGEVSIFDSTTGTSYVLNQNDQVVRKMQMAVSYDTKKIVTADGKTTTVTEGGFHPGTARTFQFSTSDGPTTIGTAGGPITIRQNFIMSDKLAAENAKKETLGPQILEGVTAQGTRITNTIETGAIGNDRPILVTEERWYSPDLQLNMIVKRSDPRSGEEITRLTNVSRNEPDPSLFTVPATYHQAK